MLNSKHNEDWARGSTIRYIEKWSLNKHFAIEEVDYIKIVVTFHCYHSNVNPVILCFECEVGLLCNYQNQQFLPTKRKTDENTFIQDVMT